MRQLRESLQMPVGFVNPLAAQPQPAVEKRVPACCAARPPPSEPTRRRALVRLLALPLALLPHESLADRTGKYSTKLTAKRRYLPRIAKGMKALGALSTALQDGREDWQPDVSSFATENAEDLKTALDLFGTTFFSEGNKIGEKERTLSECVREMFASIATLTEAANAGDKQKAAASWTSAALAANRYVEVAKLQETVPLISL